MGDTENGSWGSSDLGGYIRREEARKEFMDTHTAMRHLFEKVDDTELLDALRLSTDNLALAHDYICSKGLGVSVCECPIGKNWRHNRAVLADTVTAIAKGKLP